MAKLVTFREPHSTGGIATVLIPQEDAVAYQKAWAVKENDFQYFSDDDALGDFMSVRFATFTEGDDVVATESDACNAVDPEMPSCCGKRRD